MDHGNTRVQQKEAFLNIAKFWFLEISFKTKPIKKLTCARIPNKRMANPT